MTNYGLLNPKGTEVIVKHTQNPTQMQSFEHSHIPR